MNNSSPNVPSNPACRPYNFAFKNQNPNRNFLYQGTLHIKHILGFAVAECILLPPALCFSLSRAAFVIQYAPRSKRLTF